MKNLKMKNLRKLIFLLTIFTLFLAGVLLFPPLDGLQGLPLVQALRDGAGLILDQLRPEPGSAFTVDIADITSRSQAAAARAAARQAALERAATAAPLPQAAGPDRVLATNQGEIAVFERSTAGLFFQRDSREYQLANGDIFRQQRLTYSGDAPEQQVVAAIIHLKGEAGTLRRPGRDSGEWEISPLSAGRYENRMYFLETDQEGLIAVPPLTYYPRENQMLEELPEAAGTMEIREETGGWLVIFYAPARAGAESHCFYLLCQGPLADWADEQNARNWLGYDFTQDNRWCYQGYYYTAPSLYIPSGEHYYHRLPAAYIPAKLAFGSDRAGQGLALCMLDVMLELQNQAGWFPTYAGSQWLAEDYLIEPGFYDTRFNSDLLKSLIHLATTYGIDEFAWAALKYGAWYLQMAQDHHFTVYTAAGAEGWLVYDYYQPGQPLPTHCSLNHQAAEIMVLFQLYDLSGDPEYQRLAEKMLDGVTAVGPDWVKDNGSLHYAYLPDGSCGLDDYLYLTYNDLYLLQQELRQRYGRENEGVGQLLATKLAWLRLNNVSGYLGFEP